jgi:hypothetical protein
MSVNIIPTWQVQQYSTNIQILLQQKGSRLAGSVMVGTHVGKQASPVDQVGAIQAQKVVGRFGPMGRIDAPTDRRWVFPTDYEVPQLVDKFDMLRIIVDPKSSYVTNAAYALGRAKDDEIIAAFFGDSKTGEGGGTTVTFPASQIVAESIGGANSGLNVAKLREASRILLENEVDPDEPRFVAITAEQHDNLLNEIQVISLDYNTRPTLVDGKVTAFMGFNFIHTERLPKVATERKIPAWVKSGMHLGQWQDITARVNERQDLQGIPWQVYSCGTFGATRLEEKKIVQIECVETA